MTTLDLFNGSQQPLNPLAFAPGAKLLPQFCAAQAETIYALVLHIIQQAPLRFMRIPSGLAMSVAISNCGRAGWVSDRMGYRYSALDPHTQQAWPAMPPAFSSLATAAAKLAGYADFYADVCLINRYQIGARMGLHQDKDEQDFSAPIVSVSLGLPATFMFGGLKRNDKVQRLVLQHGDVVVWGGESRLYFHGVAPLKASTHAVLGQQRINLTFRKIV